MPYKSNGKEHLPYYLTGFCVHTLIDLLAQMGGGIGSHYEDDQVVARVCVGPTSEDFVTLNVGHLRLAARAKEEQMEHDTRLRALWSVLRNLLFLACNDEMVMQAVIRIDEMLGMDDQNYNDVCTDTYREIEEAAS